MALRDQLRLSLFDDTSLLGLTAAARVAAAQPILRVSAPDEPPEVPTVDYRLTGERRLAATRRERAADNLAAIELSCRIEVEHRPATADKQQTLARFVGFSASELATRLFPPTGESFTPAWCDLGCRLANGRGVRSPRGGDPPWRIPMGSGHGARRDRVTSELRELPLRAISGIVECVHTGAALPWLRAGDHAAAMLAARSSMLWRARTPRVSRVRSTRECFGLP